MMKRENIFNINVEGHEFVEGDLVYFTVKKDIKDKEYENKQIIISDIVFMAMPNAISSAIG